MATKKKTASETVKKAAPAKKAAPVKKTAATKKAAPQAVKKAEKAPSASKTTDIKKVVSTKPAKKTAPEKAKVSADTKAPEKKTTQPTTSTKKTATAASKEVTKATKVKEVVPKVTPAPTKEVLPKNMAKTTDKKTKTIIHKQVSTVPSARSEIVDAVRPLPRKTTNKPGVIIAHRKVEKKVNLDEPGITMKEYNPPTRSLLDEPEHTSGPVFRYSDEELNEFKELITKRLDNARKELNYLQGLITRKDEAGTDDTDNRFNHMEDGSGAMEREQLSQLAGRQIQFINHLEKAMIRIENKTYGICRVTGKLIDKARLRAVPHATLSIEAKNTMNK